MKKVNFALIGCGYWGKNHLKTLTQLKEARVLYVCDSKKPTLDIPPEINYIQNYNEILENTDIDAVVIATPTSTHYDLGFKFLKSGKHVLIEKPISTNSQESQSLCELANSKKLRLMVGEIFRFNPAVNFIESMIQKKELGELRYIESRRVGLGPIRNDVSSLWDLATHDIYLSNLFIGKSPLSVACNGISHNGILEDIACLNLRYQKPNVLSSIYVNWEHPIKERMIVVGGTEKAVKFDDIEPSEKIAIYERTVDYFDSGGNFGDFQSSIRSGNIVIPKLSIKQPLEEELKHFISCINDLSIKMISSGSDGLQTVKVLEAAEASIKENGREINIK